MQKFKIRKILILIGILSLFSVTGVSAQEKEVIVERELDNLENSQDYLINKTDSSVDTKETQPRIDIFINGIAQEETTDVTQTAETKITIISSDQPIIVEKIDFQNTEIREALETIVQKSGLIMIKDPDISGEITLQLENVDVWDILKIVLEKNKLAYAYENGIIRILTAKRFKEENGYDFGGNTEARVLNIQYADIDKILKKINALKSEGGKIIVHKDTKTLVLIDSPRVLDKMMRILNDLDSPLATEVFYLRYALAKDVKKIITPQLTEDIGKIEYDSISNKVVITDTYKRILEMTKLIKGIDTRQDILIEARMYQLQLSEEHRSGVDWEAIVSDYQGWDLPKKEKSSTGTKLSIGTVTGEDYDILIEALETVGELNKVAEIQLQAVVNKKSRVSFNTLSVDSKRSRRNIIKNTEQQGYEIDMPFVPVLKGEGVILIKLSLKLLWIKQYLGTGRMEEELLFSSDKNISIEVKDDEVIVIGGLVQENEVRTTSKFPLLGDIPLVGFVFRKQNKFIEATEFVVFITPKSVAVQQKQ